MLASAENLGFVTTGRLHYKTSNALVLNLRIEFRKALMYVYNLSNSEVTIRISPILLISLYFQKASWEILICISSQEPLQLLAKNTTQTSSEIIPTMLARPIEF